MRTSHGFSMIEILISTVLIGIVILGVAQFSQSFFSSYEFSIDEGVAIDHAQTALQTIERELREMRIGEDGSYPLVTANDNEIVFYSDVDDDDLVDRVRYYVSGTDLVKQVIPYSTDQNYVCAGGCIICHNGATITIPETAWPAHNAHTTDYIGTCQAGGGQNPTPAAYEKIVASYLVSDGPLFRYFNGNWPGDITSNPLVSGQRLLNTRLIEIGVSVDLHPDRLPEPFQVSTFTHLRNLKDNL